jgi:hypothetical protein
MKSFVKLWRGTSRNVTMLFALTLTAASLPVHAQVIPADTTGQTPGSNVVFFGAPPADFDPFNALPSELEQYGFPPRPDPANAVPFARWKKLVTSPQTRLTNLTAKATNVIHGPVRETKIQSNVANTTAATSVNWSAYAVTDTSGTFKPNGSYVYAEWNVPAVGVENCNYTPYMSSQWIGFDGAFVSGDVLQAGTEVDGCPAHYYAWYEWFTSGCTVNSANQPCYSYSLNLPVNPGDLVVAEVWYTTAAPNGHAYMYNYTTQQSASVGFNQPTSASANYVGNSVEWVVERPNGGAPNLTNYVADQFNWTLAYNGSSYFYPGSSPAGSTTYNISMTCPGWNPSSSCPSTTDISTVDLFGIYTLWFYDWAPAYQ